MLRAKRKKYVSLSYSADKQPKGSVVKGEKGKEAEGLQFLHLVFQSTSILSTRATKVYPDQVATSIRRY